MQENRLWLPMGPRTTFDWLYPFSDRDDYGMGLSEHREDMDSLWSFVDEFMSGTSRCFFATLDLKTLPSSQVDIIAVLVGKMLRVYSCLWDMNECVQTSNSDDSYVEELLPNGDWYDSRRWKFRLSDEGLVFIEEDGEENKRDRVLVNELQRDDFRWRLANYVFSAWDMPFTFGSLVRIGINECDFKFEEYSYDSADRGTVRGIRCIDPNDRRCSYQFISQDDGKQDSENYNCVLTGVWPPRDCEGSMWSRIIEEPSNVQSYFSSEPIEAEDNDELSAEYRGALVYLRRAVGRNNADFRDGQWEAIDGVLHNRRQLVVQRTGWGKSMIYFIASKFLREQGRGMTLLISPLLALMRNQIAAAQRVGIVCDTINSTNREQWREIEARVISGACDFLIVAPERFANEEFCTNVLDRIKNNIGLLVVDEAHCVSDWGHDFRPDYKKISNLLKGLPPNMPVLATTATANMRVVRDIEAQLGGRVDVSRGSLVRKSLFLQNIRLRTQEERLAWIVETLKDRINGSGVVYALTIRDAERVARWLRMNGLSAYAYSSGAMPPDDMEPALREELEESETWKAATKDEARSNAYRIFLEDLLLKNRIRALVATSALSMGFDKPDLTFVIHYQRPKSVVDYYQQVGRAGRGVNFAYGILLNGDEDDEIAEYFIKSAFPKERDVKEMLSAIGGSDGGLSVIELMARMNVRRGKIEQALKFVMSENPSPVVKVKSKYVATPFLLQYELPTENIQRLTDIRHQELARMDEYVRTGDCLMKFLCSELDSPADEPSCQRCGNCCPQEALPTGCDTSLAQKAAEFLNKSDLPIMPRRQWADVAKAATAFGIEAKKNIPAALIMEEGRALSVYGAGGLGRLVPHGKYRTTPPRFDDRLVEASVELLARWNPEKRPEWVTCIPSRRTPTLVPDFARRLAEKLGFPFVECLRKVKDTPPQKEMENSSFQQNNLIGAFEVVGTLPTGVCFLVDDMVDSKWTLTIAAAMLRDAGVTAVVPFALADSSGGE